MKFLSIFKSQIPSIIKRLKNIRVDLNNMQDELERLAILEKSLVGTNSEDFLTRTMNSHGVALWAKDFKGHFIFVNQVCCKTILNCSENEALSRTDDEFSKDSLSRICMLSDAKVIISKKTRRFIEYASYGKGKIVCIDTIKSPLLKNAVVVGTTGTGINITEYVPLKVLDQNRSSGSIEIPVDLMLGTQKLVEILERRKKSREENTK